MRRFLGILRKLGAVSSCWYRAQQSQHKTFKPSITASTRCDTYLAKVYCYDSVHKTNTRTRTRIVFGAATSILSELPRIYRDSPDIVTGRVRTERARQLFHRLVSYKVGHTGLIVSSKCGAGYDDLLRPAWCGLFCDATIEFAHTR